MLNEYQKFYVDEHLDGKEYFTSESHKILFDTLANGENRFNIPIELDFDLCDSVQLYLDSKDYVIDDSVKGTVYKKSDKRKFKIGKLLAKEKDLDFILYDYKSSKECSIDKLTLIISRDKYDIASMSTNKKWSSCMELPPDDSLYGGSEHKTITYDFKHNTLIGYLVKNNETDIDNAIGRILIKKFKSDTNCIWKCVNTVYGNVPNNVIPIVNEILSKFYPIEYNTVYRLCDKLYEDSSDDYHYILKNGLITEDADYQCNYIEGNLNDFIDEQGKHQPAVKCNDCNIPLKKYYKNGLLHRENDLPAIVSNNLIKWSINGKEHRNSDEPSSIMLCNDGSFKFSYRKHGLLHRDDKPAVIVIKNGQITLQEYYQYGVLHNPINTFNTSSSENNVVRYVYKYDNILSKAVYKKNNNSLEISHYENSTFAVDTTNLIDYDIDYIISESFLYYYQKGKCVEMELPYRIVTTKHLNNLKITHLRNTISENIPSSVEFSINCLENIYVYVRKWHDGINLIKSEYSELPMG